MNIALVQFSPEQLRELEKAWLDQAAILKTHLISPLHDAAAKGNITRLEGFSIIPIFTLQYNDRNGAEAARTK